MSTVIDSISQLQSLKSEVSQNELYCNHVLNRDFNNFIQADNQLYEMYKSIYNELGIVEYSNSISYNIGDLVWFRLEGTDNLYLLKCIKQNNTNIPDVDGGSNYEISKKLQASGWKNENDKLTILELGLEQVLKVQIQQKLSEHESDEDYHPFGKIDITNLDDTLLRKDLENVNPNRSTTFYPRLTNKLEPDETILYGFYKYYDNGILEYDIIFKFGDANETEETSIFNYSNDISANNADIKITGGITTSSKYSNKSYFYNSQHTGIFNYNSSISSDNSSTIGQLVQKNRNNYVNTYCATINFPKRFRDTNYMVFSNMILSQCDKGDNILKLVPSANEIMFCNKSAESITALNVTYPNGNKFNDKTYNTVNNGLAANSFHCKIIGIGAG